MHTRHQCDYFSLWAKKQKISRGHIFPDNARLSVLIKHSTHIVHYLFFYQIARAIHLQCTSRFYIVLKGSPKLSYPCWYFSAGKVLLRKSQRSLTSCYDVIVALGPGGAGGALPQNTNVALPSKLGHGRLCLIHFLGG